MALLLLTAPWAGAQQSPWGLVDFAGTVGTSRVGMVFDLGQATAMPPHFSASYFYVRHLTDIPLQGSVTADGYALVEQGGGGRSATFMLHAVDRNGGRVSDLSHATGLEGAWKSSDGRELPVKLALSDSLPGATAATRYGTEPGAAAKIEGTAQRFLKAVEAGDRKTAGGLVQYPLRVNMLKLKIQDGAQLDAHWAAIFTPAYVACLKTLVPHDMFTNAEGSMMGSGTVWLTSGGVWALNACTPQ